MTHLLKLELKKFGLLQNTCIALLAIVLCILFITVSLIDSMTDPMQTKDTFESTFLVIKLLISFIFLVYSSVLTSSLVISEYSQRTVTILFSYPLNKKALIAAKMILIMIFTAIAIPTGCLCCCGYLIGADALFNMLEGSFRIAYLSEWIPSIVITTIVCSILSWWPFVIGMIKKSIPATIITSLLVIVIRQVVITKNPTNQENLWQIGLTLILTAIAAFLIFRKKVSDISS